MGPLCGKVDRRAIGRSERFAPPRCVAAVGAAKHLHAEIVQRVALARCIVVQPKLLLFDEPLSNLDAKLREKVRVEIREIQKQLGITAIYVTHDQAEALAISDKIITMNGGHIIQNATPRNIYDRPNCRFVADFIGTANIVPCTVLSINGAVIHVRSAYGELDAIDPDCTLNAGAEGYNAEIQKACRQSGKPKGLRLGANIRYLTDDSKRWVTENDLFEVGLNAECFTDEDVSWLKDHGVHVLSNLGDYPAWWEKLVQLDVLGFKTNYAGAYTAWWQNAIANAPQGK